MLQTGELEEIKITRGDGLNFSLAFFTDAAMTIPLDLVATFDAAQMDIRNSRSYSGTIITSLSLDNGLEFDSTNILKVDAGAFEAEEGKYFFDIRFTKIDGDPVTPLRGSIQCTNNISVFEP